MKTNNLLVVLFLLLCTTCIQLSKRNIFGNLKKRVYIHKQTNAHTLVHLQTKNKFERERNIFFFQLFGNLESLRELERKTYSFNKKDVTMNVCVRWLLTHIYDQKCEMNECERHICNVFLFSFLFFFFFVIIFWLFVFIFNGFVLYFLSVSFFVFFCCAATSAAALPLGQ